MISRRTLLFIALAAAGHAPAASAQSVLVRVIEAGTARPMFGAIATLYDAGGARVNAALTDERGRFLFTGLTAGTYRVEAEMLGHATAASEPFDLPAGRTVVRELALEPRAIEMEGIAVEAEGGRCSVRPEEGLRVADVWEEARKALSAAALTDRRQVYRYRTLQYTRDLDRGTLAVRDEQRRRSNAYLRTPFESRPAQELMQEGFVQGTEKGDLYFAPDARVLLSDPFLDTHCFRLRTGEKETEGLVGLRFQPVRGREIPDISGTMWLDPATSELRFLEYRYEYINREFQSDMVGGRVDFQRLPDGTWIIPEWWIRMPTVGVARDPGGRQRRYIAGYRQVGGLVTRVQENTGAVVVESSSGTVEGIVLDSLQAEPLAGATVSVVGSAETVTTGADGRFRFQGLPQGVYQVAFTHPYLQRLGYEPPPETVKVEKGAVVALRFVAPSTVDAMAEACPAEFGVEGTAPLLGWVRDGPDGHGVADATVRITWSGFRFRAHNPYQVRKKEGRGDGWWFRANATTQGVEVTTTPDGFFRACAVPEDVPVTLTAAYGSAPSEPLNVRIPEGSAAYGVEVVLPVTGTGSVTGIVTSWETGEPVAGAEVTVDGLEATVATDASGAFRFEDVPAGPREVRVAHLAFAVAHDSIAVRPGEIVDVAVRMVPEAVEIRGVQVEVRSREAREEKARGVAENAVTRKELESVEDRMLSILDVLKVKGGPRLMITYPPSRQGMDVDLCIRGRRDLGSDDLLTGTCKHVMVVLDGMIMWAPSGPGDAPPPGTYRELLSLRPDEVEKVEYLSGFEGRFRYGDRGREGVISIETRRGGRR